MRFAILCAAAAACVSTSAFAQSPFPPGDGHDLVAQHCVQCHAADVIISSGKTREDWMATVSTMIGMGAAIPESETTKVVDYLAKNFPPR
jgi:mono/diheme cytochrome c family protein